MVVTDIHHLEDTEMSVGMATPEKNMTYSIVVRVRYIPIGEWLG